MVCHSRLGTAPEPCLEQIQRTGFPGSYLAGMEASLTAIPVAAGLLRGPELSLPGSHGTVTPQVPAVPSPRLHSVLLWSFQEQDMEPEPAPETLHSWRMQDGVASVAFKENGR